MAAYEQVISKFEANEDDIMVCTFRLGIFCLKILDGWSNR